jgi:hypothetical protein
MRSPISAIRLGTCASSRRSSDRLASHRLGRGRRARPPEARSAWRERCFRATDYYARQARHTPDPLLWPLACRKHQTPGDRLPKVPRRNSSKRTERLAVQADSYVRYCQVPSGSQLRSLHAVGPVRASTKLSVRIGQALRHEPGSHSPANASLLPVNRSRIRAGRDSGLIGGRIDRAVREVRPDRGISKVRTDSLGRRLEPHPAKSQVRGWPPGTRGRS